MKPFFSILIPVYNKAGQMEECVRSIKAQSFADLEVVFVNDGSTDGSAEELARYCSEDSRFRTVTHGNNSSVMTARYTGMQAADGKYILFLDSDDTYSPDTCEKIHDLLEKDPVDIVRFDIIEEPEMRLRPAEEFPEGVLDAFLHGKISPTVWKNCYSSAVIKRAVERIKPFYSNMAEDLFISAVLYHCAESFAVLNDTLYHYQTGSGMST
ncbi:MAG: glycosyltransferase family 2 protein, partial [Ruminiclostridium sp.]|nr:glycosyltransferase family 2 protein [Ruminiclostridium sp.]